MWKSFASQLVVPWILFAQGPSMMDYVPVVSGAPPPAEAGAGVHDSADIFGSQASRQARKDLGRIHRESLVPVRIETVHSLDGARVAKVAGRRARSIEARQLSILMARDERDVEVVAARRGPASRLGDQQREQIRRAFLAPLQAGDADAALESGIRAIGAALESSPVSGRGLVGGDAFFTITSILAALLALSVSRSWAERDRSGRRRRRLSTPALPRESRRTRPGQGDSVGQSPGRRTRQRSASPHVGITRTKPRASGGPSAIAPSCWHGRSPVTGSVRR